MKYFTLEELVSPEILTAEKRQDIWNSLDVSLLRGLDLLREHYGKPLYINGTFGGHLYMQSGARSKDCKTGASKSMHKMRRAYDIKCDDLKALRELVRKNWRRYGITRMECDAATPTWAHIDNKVTGMDHLHEFVP